MEIIKVKNYDELSQKAAEVILKLVQSKPDCVLGLATGSTPIGTYQCIRKAYDEGKVDFSTVKSVNLDEYVGLPATHPQSYNYFMKDNLFNHVNICEENTNVPQGQVADGQAECDRYNAKIAEVGGIDLQLLGIGANGHIGFNEPADEFSRGTHMVELTLQTREDNARFFESLDEVPTHAYTMGMENIMGAKQILLIASGANKAQALYDTVKGPVTPKVPASILQNHDNVIIIADEEAASML
ncbi:MAG: glucosamine-6-phosphate deaminase [Lachnospiraceae bacterium]|nr:glucosamine-6-phosphate deaminase [Lachnospiraceae bacterium]